MSTELPARAARISDEIATEIVRLSVRGFSDSEIARRVGVHRRTVRRALDRTRAALSINTETEQDRAEALATYREIQRTAWAAVEAAEDLGQPAPARHLAEIRLTQARIDALLGLAPAGPDDPVMILAQFKATVVTLIRDEAPQLAPVLAQRLLEASNGKR